MHFCDQKSIILKNVLRYCMEGTFLIYNIVNPFKKPIKAKSELNLQSLSVF